LRKSAAGFRLPGASPAGSSVRLKKIEETGLNTAKVRQIASLGGS